MTEPTKKEASALIYLVEELGDARLLCEKLQRYVARAVELVEKSEKKDHFFEVAGDLMSGIPETTEKLNQALQAVALATNRLDYEDVKQELRPEKAEELESVLEDVRIRPVRRRGTTMTPEEALKTLRKLAVDTREAGALPVGDALRLVESLETGLKTASADDVSAKLASLADALESPPKGTEGVSRARLAQVIRRVVAQALTEDGILAHRVAARVASAQENASEQDTHPESLQEDQGIEKEAKGSIDIKDLKTLQKALEDIVVEAKKHNSKDIGDIAQKALKHVKVAAESEEKEGRFEEGKPADPTKNMDPEDAKKWKENVDHDGSNLKKEAARIPSTEDMVKEMKDVADSIIKTRGKIRSLTESLGAVIRDVSGTGIVYSGGSVGAEKSRLEKLKKDLYNLDGEMRIYDAIEAMIPHFKKHKNDKTASEKEASDWKALESSDSKLAAKSVKDFQVGDIVRWTRKHLQQTGQNYNKTINGKILGTSGNFLKVQWNDWDGPSLVSPAAIELDPKHRRKASETDERAARFEEGKPADPTKNMSPEDAEKWKENVDHDGSNLKDASAWKAAASDFDRIKPGSEVTVVDTRGRKQTGKAQKKTPAGWVIDLGGKTTIATPDTVVGVK